MYDNTRSIYTILNNTAIITSFSCVIEYKECFIEVRRISSRKSSERQHFIINVKKDVEEAIKVSKTSSIIIPVYEAVFRHKKVLFLSDAIDKFEKIKKEEDENLKYLVSNSIHQYMRETFD